MQRPHYTEHQHIQRLMVNYAFLLSPSNLASHSLCVAELVSACPCLYVCLVVLICASPHTLCRRSPWRHPANMAGSLNAVQDFHLPPQRSTRTWAMAGAPPPSLLECPVARSSIVLDLITISWLGVMVALHGKTRRWIVENGMSFDEAKSRDGNLVWV